MVEKQNFDIPIGSMGCHFWVSSCHLFFFLGPFRGVMNGGSGVVRNLRVVHMLILGGA